MDDMGRYPRDNLLRASSSGFIRFGDILVDTSGSIRGCVFAKSFFDGSSFFFDCRFFFSATKSSRHWFKLRSGNNKSSSGATRSFSTGNPRHFSGGAGCSRNSGELPAA
jgi:hypothetical protein